MESHAPEIAVQHTRTSLEAAGHLSPGSEARVRARLHGDVLEALDAAARSDFLPAQVDLAVAGAIHAELGRDGARQVARESLRRSLNGSLLGGLVRSAATLFGLTPPGLLRWAGRGYSRVCRRCGDLQVVSSSDGLVQLSLTGLPHALETPSYLEAIGGSLEAFLDVCQCDGAVEVEPRPGGARFLLHWKARPGMSPA